MATVLIVRMTGSMTDEPPSQKIKFRRAPYEDEYHFRRSRDLTSQAWALCGLLMIQGFFSRAV